MRRPSQDLFVVIDALSRARALDVMFVLGSGAMRRGNLRRALDGATTDKALSRSLSGLERAGLIHRQVLVDCLPPGVLYVLTPSGQRVHASIMQLEIECTDALRDERS